MFESLTEKLQSTFKKLSGQGKLTEKNVSDALREVRFALLEADVGYKIVRQFVDDVKVRSLGQEVLGSLTPELQISKIIGDELTSLMGQKSEKVQVSPSGTTVLMMVGLQGSGKTTASAKLALKFKTEGRNPLLVAADIYRPAAIEQLKILGDQIGIPVFSMGTDVSPVSIAQAAVEHALNHGNTFVILDTAGRLHIDEELMGELENIQCSVNPTETLLVVDSMTGQDAVNVAEHFSKDLNITGVILTKLDGDARGGAALSVRAATGTPIKFVSTGEKIDGHTLEEFYPDRMASRILGQGDFKTLLDRAESIVSEEQAKELEEKLMSKSGLDFNDMLTQFEQIKKMGSLDQLIGMVPGMSKALPKDAQIDESQIKHAKSIIQSMTLGERRNYAILDRSRRQRIAKGSGTRVSQVNQLVSQLKMMNQMFNQQTAHGSQFGLSVGKGLKNKLVRKKRKRRR
ncbi:TPA: signal recognition particle protein [Candidatus Poribacteria bacterium]|jgi:signal recognition particle subunit SRP54|nr:signal recognition particle protein [Candidatus Poribacteria bacterium]HCK15507.1 signal recognition particle protein [Candidatus Poribacteria bacterium]|tara:strand:- start:1515 stop:2891 length:1377 start_codon:yes stop_codon:yes gene_type:complete